MKKENIIIAIIITIVVMIAVILYILFKPKYLTCEINNTLLDGFDNQEIVKVKIKNKKINEIWLDKYIVMSNKYVEDNVYNKSLELILKNGYENIGGKINVDNNKVSVSVDTKQDGIALDNVLIKRNSEYEEYSLKLDLKSDYKDKERGLKIGDKITKKELKKKIEKLKYNCK